MATFYQPLIRSEDYQAFRRLLQADLPDSFEVWGEMRFERLAKLRNAGHDTPDIEVNPTEFIAHCHATGQNPSLHALWNFAFDVAQRQNNHA
jgi:hypothetical protein